MSIAASSRVERLAAAMAPIQRMVDSPIFARRGAPGVADFMVGNPQEMPLTDFVDVLRRNAEPQDKNWFAYKLSEPEARIPVARSLTRLTGLDWGPEDVFMTNAGFGALTVTLRAITEPGDEVIYLSPPWFFYELLIAAADAIPVRLNLAPPVFDLEPEAIAAAITPRSVINMVASGQTVARRLTVAEGLTVSEVFQLLESAEGLVGALPPPPPEGSLLPETYFYAFGDQRAEMVKRMQRAMQTALAELWPRRVPDLPFEGREEALTLPTRRAMRRGLSVTGGVITSAGIVLAGTFSVLAVLPLVALTQIGITVAFGVLLDTFVVRSILVPALTFELGGRIWWPSALSRHTRDASAPTGTVHRVTPRTR